MQKRFMAALVFAVVAPAAAAPTVMEEKRPAEEIAVAGSLGQLSEHEIATTFKAHMAEITACYEKVQAEQAYLGGQVDVKVHLSGAGKPASVFIAASDFGNYALESCVQRTVADFDFPAPHFGNSAEFRYPLQFKAKAAAVAWERSKVFDSTRGRKMKAELKNCAGDAVEQPVRVTVYVAKGGKVMSAGLSSDTPIDERYGNCVVQTAAHFRLDAPKSGIAKVTLDPSEVAGPPSQLTRPISEMGKGK